MKINVEQVKQLLNDTSFLDECSEAQSIEELTVLFHNKGVMLTNKQVEGLLAAAMASNTSEELAEDALESVVGGVSVWGTIKNGIMLFKKGLKWGSKFYDWEQSLYR